MQKLLLPLLLFTIMVFTSCDSGPDKTNPELSVKGFLKAIAKNDYDKAASFVIKKRRGLIQQLGKAIYPNTRGPENLEYQIKEPAPDDYVFEGTSITGKTAFVRYHLKADKLGNQKGVFTLIMEDGFWLLDYP